MKNFILGLLVGAIITVFSFIFFLPEGNKISMSSDEDHPVDTIIHQAVIRADTTVPIKVISQPVSGNTNRDSIVSFAKTLMGAPYLYGSADPAKGFDCSGFITYVFNHFKIAVPRSSYDFEKIGIKKDLTNCRKGDLILFTGTNPEEKAIGHIGIVVDSANPSGKPQFIHSSSGKANGVTITSMESVYYQGRYVSVVDVLSK